MRARSLVRAALQGAIYLAPVSIGTIVGPLLSSPSANATIPGEPRSNLAYYVQPGNTYGGSGSTFYNAGCTQGQRDAALSANSMVILAFGGEVNGGTHLAGGSTFVSWSTISAMAKSFADGYYVCTGADTSTVLFLAVGTNNSIQVSSADGDSWANETVSIQSAIGGDAAQVAVIGASDMELPWNSASGTETWLGGYNAHAGRPMLVNFGSADGCPYSGTGTCNNGWMQSDVYNVSYAGAAYPFPEIYNTLGNNARQWADISNVVGYMYFEGALSQYETCKQNNNPCSGTNQGPDASWQQLQSDTGQSPPFEDDIAQLGKAIVP